MKHLFFASLIFATIGTSYAECTIKAQTRSAKSKTLYVNGVTLSKKVQSALRSQCKITSSVMSQKDVLEMEAAKYKARIARIKSGK